MRNRGKPIPRHLRNPPSYSSGASRIPSHPTQNCPLKSNRRSPLSPEDRSDYYTIKVSLTSNSHSSQQGSKLTAYPFQPFSVPDSSSYTYPQVLRRINTHSALFIPIIYQS